MEDEKKFWDMIETEFGIYDILDDSHLHQIPNTNYIMMQPAPGIIIMINEDFNGKEAW
tara:strand:+ start:1386 stop:1559 length:174 start_codon:yes stop_codon:yes gene_type:complete